MEVKIGVQHATRELVVETDISPEDVEAQVTDARQLRAVCCADRRPRAAASSWPRQDRLCRDRHRYSRHRRLPLTDTSDTPHGCGR